MCCTLDAIVLLTGSCFTTSGDLRTSEFGPSDISVSSIACSFSMAFARATSAGGIELSLVSGSDLDSLPVRSLEVSRYSGRLSDGFSVLGVYDSFRRM